MSPRKTSSTDVVNLVSADKSRPTPAKENAFMSHLQDREIKLTAEKTLEEQFSPPASSSSPSARSKTY